MQGTFFLTIKQSIFFIFLLDIVLAYFFFTLTKKQVTYSWHAFHNFKILFFFLINEIIIWYKKISYQFFLQKKTLSNYSKEYIMKNDEIKYYFKQYPHQIIYIQNNIKFSNIME